MRYRQPQEGDSRNLFSEFHSHEVKLQHSLEQKSIDSADVFARAVNHREFNIWTVKEKTPLNPLFLYIFVYNGAVRGVEFPRLKSSKPDLEVQRSSFSDPLISLLNKDGGAKRHWGRGKKRH